MPNPRRICALFISALCAFSLAVLVQTLRAPIALAQSSATCNTATPAACTLFTPNTLQQIKPQAVPTSLTAVSTVDSYLMTVTVSNTTGSAITFTLADRQGGTPVAVMPAVSVASGTTYVISFPSLYWCPNGFTVVASASGLNYYASWRQ